MNRYFKLFFIVVFVCLNSNWCTESNLINFDGEVGIVNNYIWRGINRSSNGNYHMSLGWQYENWSGSFWGTYDTADDNFVTDLQSNWLEVDSTFSYTWERAEGDSIQLGYILYNFYDNFMNSQEVFARYNYDSSWNPSLTLYYDFDFNSGLYYTLEIEKSKVDRDWIYGFGMKLGYFSSFGNNFLDEKRINGRIFQNPMSNQPLKSGIGDFVPNISLTRYLDEESSISFDLATTIILDNDTYNQSAEDELHFGLSYRVQF